MWENMRKCDKGNSLNSPSMKKKQWRKVRKKNCKKIWEICEKISESVNTCEKMCGNVRQYEKMWR